MTRFRRILGIGFIVAMLLSFFVAYNAFQNKIVAELCVGGNELMMQSLPPETETPDETVRRIEEYRTQKVIAQESSVFCEKIAYSALGIGGLFGSAGIILLLTWKRK